MIELEQPGGVIVSVGGQIPNNLAMKLHRQSCLLYKSMLDQLGIDQPAWKELTSLEDMEEFVNKVG